MNASSHPRPAETQAPTRADVLVCALARELVDGDVVATGVSSPLALLAIGVAKATHAPGCTWLACVGALDPPLRALHPSTEDLAYLEGRRAEVTIAELFDHARRGRVDVVFFGAAEVDAEGATNMSAGAIPVCSLSEVSRSCRCGQLASLDPSARPGHAPTFPALPGPDGSGALDPGRAANSAPHRLGQIRGRTGRRNPASAPHRRGPGRA